MQGHSLDYLRSETIDYHSRHLRLVTYREDKKDDIIRDGFDNSLINLSRK